MEGSRNCGEKFAYETNNGNSIELTKNMQETRYRVWNQYKSSELNSLTVTLAFIIISHLHSRDWEVFLFYF